MWKYIFINGGLTFLLETQIGQLGYLHTYHNQSLFNHTYHNHPYTFLNTLMILMLMFHY